jgi:hypothetical protein
MATPAQIHANRLNAQKSTGPRSAEGKAAVRFNALTHGADAQSPVIPGEDAAALDALSFAYRDQFQPVGPLEVFLLATMVRADWAQRRLSRIEADLLRHALGESEDASLGVAFQQDAAGPNALQKIFRRQQAAQRDWYRALAELRRLQQARFESACETEETEEDVAASPAPEAAGIGFVSPPETSRSALPPQIAVSPAAALPRRAEAPVNPLSRGRVVNEGNEDSRILQPAGNGQGGCADSSQQAAPARSRI